MYRERYYPAAPSSNTSVLVIIAAIVGLLVFILSPFSDIRVVRPTSSTLHYNITVTNAETGSLLPDAIVQLRTESQERVSVKQTDSDGVAIIPLNREQFANQVLELIVQHSGYELYRKQLLVTQTEAIAILLIPEKGITPSALHIIKNPLFNESFDVNNNLWTVGQPEGRGNVAYRLSNGQYHQMVTFADKQFANVEIPSIAVQNFRWQTQTAVLATTYNGTVYTSFKFRLDEAGNYYMLRLNNTGHYGVYRFYDNEWTVLQAMTHTSAIKTDLGATNLVDIRAVGNLFTIAINGEELTTAIDGQARLAQAGQFMLSTDGPGGLSATIMFDDITITKID